MKKYSAILMAIILGAIALLSGCEWSLGSNDPGKNAQVEGEFLYYVKNESAIILDVDWEEREELVIPEALGGYPVKQIGESWSGFITAPTRYYGIRSNNTEKIVLNHSMYLYAYSFIEFNGTLVINSEQKYINVVGYREASMPNAKAIYINVPRDIDNDDSIYRIFVFLDNNHYGIIFHANGDDVATSGIINHIETDLELPEEPTKKGYKFVGWFTNMDYNETWNPDDSISGEKVTDVYAKWIEI